MRAEQNSSRIGKTAWLGPCREGEMKMPPAFEDICGAMADPGFYPHAVSSVRRIDTHISAVFLTGKWVYKLKKPVRFDFLDFTRLDDRRRYCEREVHLNRRLSSGVYAEVVPVAEHEDGGFSLAPGGTAVEYAVKMVQLPDAASLKTMLEAGKTVPEEDICAVGKKLARFYETAERSAAIDEYGRQETLLYNLEETLNAVAPFVDDHMDPEQWEFIRRVTQNFLADHSPLFTRRIDEGRIRDGHGDLKPDHVYFYNGLQIIDCIEFNNRFRYGDTVLDLAFLFMELDHLGHPDLGHTLVRTYAMAADDRSLYALIDYYRAYRALVRLKICCLSLKSAAETRQRVLHRQIQGYFQQAFHACILFGRPTLWVFFGLPASGKSTLAGLAGDALFMPVFQSDAVRKEEMPASAGGPDAPYNTGIYREAMRDHVYTHLLARAQEALHRGRSAVIDATFGRKKWRDGARRLALDADANLIFVECTSRRDTLLSRLKAREAGPAGDSDARAVHLSAMAEDFEPVEDTDPDTAMAVDTESSVVQSLHAVLADGHALKNAQTQRRIARGMS